MPNPRAIAACFAMLVMGLVSPLYAATDCAPWVARIVSIEGRVEARPDGKAPWRAASLGQAFCFGDQLRVGPNSRASVELNNDTVLRLDQNSTLILPEAERTELTFVDLIRGALHLISRVKGELEIRTPFVNAGLEGTEFVVRVLEAETLVSVIEGEVTVSNAFGSLRLRGGQVASGTKTSAPVLRLDVKPEDAVQWAIHYPAITEPGAVGPTAEIFDAQELLRVGRVDEASRAIQTVVDRDPDNSEALALASIIELAQNRKASALDLARRAVESEATASALVALSYAQQADFDLGAALQTVETATQRFPEQALLWSRLAELQASMGRRSEALASAQRSVELDPDLSRTQTVLGFANLARSQNQAARVAFDKAIQLDSADPLPRIGLGLAKIRGGELAGGRREMEVAVSLDPADALVRSYLGKAYFEEDRTAEAGIEFGLARQLDPKDPTPWLYDAIRKQAISEPIAAVRDFEKSVELNDNRAVYRSRLLLDDDLAVRNVNVGLAYAELGFSDVARSHATRSLTSDPNSASAHALLAESYRGAPRLGLARLSERLQAQQLQPLTSRPITPSELIRELDPSAGLGRFATGTNEYSAMFEDRDPRWYAAGYIGGDDSSGFEVIHSRLLENASYSLGYYKFDTDGFRPNADFDYTTYNGFVQFALSDRTRLQLEARHQEKDQGDLRMDPVGLPNTENRSLDYDTFRVGTTFDVSDSTKLLLSFGYAERDEFAERVETIFGFPAISKSLDERDAFVSEGQLQLDLENVNIIAGVGARRIELDYTDSFSFFGFTSPTAGEDDIRSSNAYLYLDWALTPAAVWTFGISYDDHDEPDRGESIKYSRVNPKIGVHWDIAPGVTVRAAHAATTKHQLVLEETLEPTQVAGFPQFFDDFNRSKADLNAIAMDLRDADVFASFEYVKREYDVVDSNVFLDEETYRAGVSAIISGRITASIGYVRQNDKTNASEKFKLTTDMVPISLTYNRPSGLFAKADWTIFDQKKRPSSGADIETDFQAVNLKFGYAWNKNRNTISFGVNDILDDIVVYQDERYKTNDQLNVYRPFVPGRTLWASVRIGLD